MNCKTFERQLALLVEGDLALAESETVQRHLASCPACRSSYSNLRQSQTLLHLLDSEPEQDQLVALRQRVMSRIETLATRRRTHWLWPAVAAAALATVGLIFWFQPSLEPTLPNIGRLAPPPPPLVKAAPEPKQAIARRPRVRHRQAAPPPGVRSVSLETKDGETVAIKMATNDPNVVIIWLPQEKEITNE